MNPDFDSSRGSAVAAAVNWLQATLLGTFASAVAVVVIGAFGLLLFLGHVPRRRATEVLLGCFILFGASSIASGVMRALDGPANGPETVAALPPPPPPIEPPVQAHSAQPDDPYAGAAVPPRH